MLEELLAAVLDATGDALVAIDAEARIVALSAAAESLTEETADRAVGRPLTAVFRLVDARTREDVRFPATPTPSARAVSERIAAARVLGPDGTERRVDRVAPVRDRQGRATGFVLVLGGIVPRGTAARRADGALVGNAPSLPAPEISQAFLASLVTSSDDAIVSKSLDGVILSWNAGAERIFGYEAAEAIGQPITMIIPPELREEEMFILARVRRGDRVGHVETERVGKDGRRIDISLTVSPVFDAHGRIIAASKVARDISSRKRTERALRDANRRKDEFLAELGHELRNPLAALRTGLDVLQLQGAETDPKLVEGMLGTIDDQLRHLVRIVDQLLELSRISRGQIELTRAPLELGRAVDSAVELSRPLIAQFCHELHVQHCDAPVWVHGDLGRVTQVVANLLSNAAKFTEPGGEIRVRVEKTASQAVIRVADTGLGISEEQLEWIFEMFAQAPEHRGHTGGAGLGVGLALSQRLVQMHGGSIEALSRGPGRGSEFVVRLPLSETATASENRAAPVLTLASTPKRVLIVDDNVNAAESLRMMLELTGHVVQTADEGVTALRAVERFSPEVVLLDIGMPGMDGYEVARRIRARDDGRDIRLLALTGWGQERDKQRAREAGFDEHLTKPIDSRRLLAMIG